MKNHKFYELAERAYYGTSFSPEKRAASECAFYDETIKELKELGASEEGILKFEKLFLTSLSAKSRCLSTMIAGRSNFPVRRAEKASERDRKITDEMLNYLERLRKAIDKQNHPEKYSSDAIRSDDENAIDKLKSKIEKLEKFQNQMKDCNKIIKDKKENKIERLAEILGTESRARELLEPDFCGRIGFASFSLTNNNAAIKAAQARITQLENAATRETKEIEIAGVKVVQNAELMRIQFFFDGKPEGSIIDLMKRHGFKWSPSNICWQRLWNNNAVYSVRTFIKPELERLI
jgi:TolA-binding protein